MKSHLRMALSAGLILGLVLVWRTAHAAPIDGLSATEIAAAQQLSERISTVEWLGPLAPVALSPFFGIACLSGLSLYGGEWVGGQNALLESSVLRNPAVFWTFLVLTILTSIPRLTKVSKPLAQAVDQVEAYAGIITMLAVRFLPGLWAAEATPAEAQTAFAVGMESVVVVQAGLMSISLDVLLGLAAALNILVINAAKFFFEFLVWITPVPFLDACFEAANKFVCAALMGLYAFSPTAATVFNLLLVVASLFILRWAHRRVVFYRHMVFDPIASRLFGKKRRQSRGDLVVFPQQSFGDFPEKARCRLIATDDGWTLVHTRWLRPSIKQHFSNEQARPEARRGWLTHTLDLHAEGASPLIFSRGYDVAWEHLPVLLRLSLADPDENEVQDRKIEFA